MKKIISLLFLALITEATSGQPCSHISQLKPRGGELFDQSAYPSDSFVVQRRQYPLGETMITLILLGHAYDVQYYNFEENPCFQVWLEQRKGEKLIRSMYFGCEEGENFCQIHEKPIYPGYFLFNNQHEFSGTLYMITENGKWYTMEGADFIYLSKEKTIYSFAPESCAGCTFDKFNLKTHELCTKEADGGDSGWKECPGPIYNLLLFDWEKRVEWDIKE